MRNTELIGMAFGLMIDFNVNNNYCLDNLTARDMVRRLEDWYDHTEIVDAEMLAAVAIEGEYDNSKDWNYCLEKKKFYFPTLPIECTEIHISEIEEALFDSFR